MNASHHASPSAVLKGQLICPSCGHVSEAVDGDWIVIESATPARQFRCPACGTRFGDRRTNEAPA